MANRLSTPERHQLRIARDTLCKWSDAEIAVLGGPTKAEARETIERLTGTPAERFCYCGECRGEKP